MPEYETRVTRVHVLPKGDQLFSELATIVELDDEAGGEFVIVRQQDDHETHQCIRISPEEWPAIRDAIDTAIKQCRSYP